MRTREFLWQEGHTAFATKEEADKEVLEILDYYADVYEDLLAVPVLKGTKSEKEKFAGALYTTSVETFLPVGKAIQGATSHQLGQNFSKVFKISFMDDKEKRQLVWQNSWGLTTRAIGVMIIFHGDDNGLVIPPRAAYNKVVIIPILFKKGKEEVMKAANQIEKDLSNFNPILDEREGYTAGWKFHDWELKGMPIRIEIGPKDVEKKQAVLVRRDTNEKEFVKLSKLKSRVKELLDKIQDNLFKKAKEFLDSSIAIRLSSFLASFAFLLISSTPPYLSTTSRMPFTRGLSSLRRKLLISFRRSISILSLLRSVNSEKLLHEFRRNTG